jgi:hypothetical protein
MESIKTWNKRSKKEKKEAEKKQAQIELEYLEYLFSAGSKLSEDQVQALAKHQLNK